MDRLPIRNFFRPDDRFVGASLHPNREPDYTPRWWLHILLFFLTLISTTAVGGLFWAGLPSEMSDFGFGQILVDPRLYVSGFRFSLPLLAILFAHEMGHYVACRLHRLKVTPPFFIPFPVPFLGLGTLGAVIRIKDPILNRKQLLDVGAWGPVAGFLATVPLLALGIAWSTPAEGPLSGSYLEFGEPLAYRALEAVFAPAAGDGSLLLHPMGVAAWFGLMVTLLNMLPFAQLDGGHVMYALFGSAQHRLAWPMMALLATLGLVWPGWWLWFAIALIMGPRHPPTWNDDIPVSRPRKILGWAALLIFVVCFTAEPIRIVIG